MRFKSGFMLLILSVSFMGCGGTAKHEALAQEMVQVMNELADGANAEDIGKVKASTEKLKELKTRTEQLPKITKAQDKAIEDKYKPQMEAAAKKMMGGIMKLAVKHPQEMKQIGESMKALGTKKQ
jgi:serine/threonine protein phosphatase PrpC